MFFLETGMWHKVASARESSGGVVETILISLYLDKDVYLSHVQSLLFATSFSKSLQMTAQLRVYRSRRFMKFSDLETMRLCAPSLAKDKKT